MNGPSEEEVDRLERKMIEAMQGSAGSSRKIRGECMHCQKVVVRLPDFDAGKGIGWAQWNRRKAVTGLYGNSVREEMEHDGHGINVVGGVG